MFGPTATLNFGAPAPSPGDASAQAPQPPEAFPAAAPDGAEQLAMLASPPVNYQQTPELSPPMTGPPPPEAQQGNTQGEQPCMLEDTIGKCKACPRAYCIQQALVRVSGQLPVVCSP